VADEVHEFTEAFGEAGAGDRFGTLAAFFRWGDTLLKLTRYALLTCAAVVGLDIEYSFL
jgi:hypothetical protein